MVVSTLSLAVLLGWIGSLTLGVAPLLDAGSEAAERLRGVGVILLSLAFLGTVTFLGAVVTRSTIGGAVVGILAPVLLEFLDFLLERVGVGVALISPTEHLEYLQVRWADYSPDVVVHYVSVFGRPIHPFVSVLVVLGYILLLLGGSLHLFNRRDLTGD